MLTLHMSDCRRIGAQRASFSINASLRVAEKLMLLRSAARFSQDGIVSVFFTGRSSWNAFNSSISMYTRETKPPSSGRMRSGADASGKRSFCARLPMIHPAAASAAIAITLLAAPTQSCRQFCRRKELSLRSHFHPAFNYFCRTTLGNCVGSADTITITLNR